MYEKYYYKLIEKIRKYKLLLVAFLSLNIVFSSFANAELSSYTDCKDKAYCATLNSVNPYNMYSLSKLGTGEHPIPAENVPSTLKDKFGNTYTQYAEGITTLDKWKRTNYSASFVNYASTDKKNVSVDINNINAKTTVLQRTSDDTFKIVWLGLEFKAHGQNSSNKITIGSPTLKANIYEKDDLNTEQYRNLSIDFKDVNYTGDITLIGSKEIIDNAGQRLKWLDTALVSAANYESGGVRSSALQNYWRSAGVGGYFHMNNVTLNGNLHLENVLFLRSNELGSEPFTITDSTINGDFYWSSVNSLTLQLKNDSFRNSKITFLRDSLDGFSVTSNQDILVSDSKFTDSTMRYGYASTAVIDKQVSSYGTYHFTNNTFKNTSLEIQDGSIRFFLNHTNFQGGKIKITSDAKIAPSIVSFNGAKVNISSLEIGSDGLSLGTIFNFRKMTHNTSDPKNPHAYTYQEDLTSSSVQTKSLMLQEAYINSSKRNANSDLLTDFSGNISLSGGKNTFNVQDESSLHDGNININGGLNTFTITGKSSLDKMNITIKAIQSDIKKINDNIARVKFGTKDPKNSTIIEEYQVVWSDDGTQYVCNAKGDSLGSGKTADGTSCVTADGKKTIQASDLNKQITSVATNGATISTTRSVHTPDGVEWTCEAGQGECVANPNNTFSFSDASYKNGYISIQAGINNTFDFKNTSVDTASIKVFSGQNNSFTFDKSNLKDTDIEFIGGKTNALSFADSTKIGGHILISGGESNTFSFTQGSQSSLLSGIFTPDATTHMSSLKSAILTSKVDETFLAKIQTIAKEKFKGDIMINSDAKFNTTTNKLTFKNTGIDGNILLDSPNGVGEKFYTTIEIDNSLLYGNMTFNGAGTITREKFNKSAIIGNINISDGSSYLELDDSQLYGNIITKGGINIVSLKNNSVFAGSIDTYGGTSYIDISQSMAMGQNNTISNINTYGGRANITLSIDNNIAKLLQSQKINPVFEVGSYNDSLANIGIFGPITGTGNISYFGGIVNLFFADGGDGNNPKRFFTCGSDGFISATCLAGAEAEFSPNKDLYSTIIKTEDSKSSTNYWNRFVTGATKVGKGVFRVNGYTGLDGIAFSLDAKKADEILAPFRNEYPTNYASIFVDKSDVIDPKKTKEEERVYRMELGGVFVGAEYNLTSSNNKRKYQVAFKPNTVFVGSMNAATDNTDFVLDQGVKLVVYSKSNFNVSSLLAKKTFDVNTDTMFDSTLIQKGNVIIDLATEGKVVNRVFHKDSYSTMVIGKMDNVNNAIFRIAIDTTKSDPIKTINTNAQNADRIIIKSVGEHQHLKNYLQIYQDYTNLKTGNLANNQILVAISKNSSKSGAKFDTSSSDVKQGFDLVHTDIVAKPITLDDAGNINLTPASGSENAIGYFVKSVSTQLDSSDLGQADNAITSNYSIYLANINNLNKRLGEVRDNFYAQGVYSRVFNGLNTNSYGGESSKIYSTNIQLGYDYGWKTNNGQQFLGVAGTYGYDSIKGDNYNGNVQVGEVAGYYSYVNDSGIYLDAILKYSYIHNDISLKDNYLSNTPLNTHTGSIGGELGYRYYMDKKKSYYLEPSLELILGMMSGGYIDQVSKTGLLPYASEYLPVLKTSLSDILSFRSKLGATFGYRILTSKNETNLRLSAYYVGDFNNGGKTTYSTNYSQQSKSLLASNHQMMINIGANSVLDENWRVYADIDAGFLGQYFNQTYLVSLGLRYEFGHALNPLAAKLAQEKQNAKVKYKEIRTASNKAIIMFNQQKLVRDKDFQIKQFKIDNLIKIAQSSGDKATQTKLAVQRYEDESKYIKENHALELAILNKLQEAQMKELQLKHQKQEKILALRQANRLTSANNNIKASLKASQAKETKKLESKEDKELSKLKATQTKELKDLQAKQDRELKALQAK